MPALGMKLSDIYYVIFRQKWLIAVFLALALIASLVVFLGQKTAYWSEAKLLVRYVTESTSMEAAVGTTTKSPDSGGETIINSELEILNSLDLCEEVAKLVGAERVLAKAGGGSNTTAAARIIYNGLKPENPRRSNIIKVRFSHPDPTMCQIVLRQLITSYLERHRSIHRTAGDIDDILSREAQSLLYTIRENETELQKLNRKAGVISVEDAKKTYGETVARLRSQQFDAEADLAAARAALGKSFAPTNENKSVDPVAPLEKVSEYKVTCVRLEGLREREFVLMADYTDENPMVIRVREQIVENEKKKKALETEFPKLTAVYVPPSQTSNLIADGRPSPRRVAELESRVSYITNQLAQVRSEIAVLDGLEGAIAEIKRKLQRDNQNYMHITQGLEAANYDEKIAAAKMSNIQTVQNPSVPAPNVSQRLKLVASTFGGVLIVGIAIAFFIEIFFDRTIRRPEEIETKLRMPLFLSIPKLGLNGHSKMLPFPNPSAESPASESTGDLAQTWDAEHPLRRYIDGLRDATLTHFGGDPHKPKLIGITSCGEHAGVTSIAAGLAGALSETGDGNVLLLNLNYAAEAAHPFYRGELACCLTDALELDKRANGKVLQNLYVATAGNPNDPATQSLPKQLARVVPKLRVCDYDYIVFDLPPTTPTTMTARLAGMMDLVILVVESEKDTHETVKQAGKLLARSKASVSTVLNKVRNPVPKWLQKGA